MAPHLEDAERIPPVEKTKDSGSVSGISDDIPNAKEIPVGSGETGKVVQQLRQLNAEVSKPVESCAHWLISERCRAQPEALAVCAWDGDLTYGQLDSLADSLAASLSNKGVRTETFVPICSEKSRWVPVAMLAVLKAGGAFALLDPSHPLKRLVGVCQTLNAKVVVSSRERSSMASQLAPTASVVVVDDGILQVARAAVPASHVGPGNAAWAIFTSGSTEGIPKGIVIEHRSFCSAAVAHSAALDLTSSSRVLQFASYAFDACLLETLSVLVVGGCVCIPSEIDRRRDLVGSFRRFGVNWAFLTPSTARIIDAAELWTLSTLVLGGEALSHEDILKWAPHVQLFNGYGPAECTIFATASRCQGPGAHHANIGYGMGASCWVVDEDDPEKLKPVGSVGEILISGPTVSRGYIGDERRTADAFVAYPGWLSSIVQPDQNGRVHRTGDLGRFLEDGSIQFVGRKDTQAKIHGQRLESSEVEYHLRKYFPDVSGVAVEVVTPANKGDACLVAFLAYSIGLSNQNASFSKAEDLLTAPSDDFRSRIHAAKTQFNQIMPTYMVPTAFLQISSIPLTTSGKTDRRLLRQVASSMTRQQLQQYCEAAAEKRPPSSKMEATIQQLWAEVLQLPLQDIGVDDSFWSLGGSSIHAMKLAGIARRSELDVGVADVWDHQSLEEMAAAIQSRAKCVTEEAVVPFSLIQPPDDRTGLVQLALKQCHVQEGDVEDIYPCTPLQEGLVSLAAKRPSAYTISREYQLPISIDVERFRVAWDATIDANPILRTRIVQAGSGAMYQVVVRESALWNVRNPGQEVPKDWLGWKLGQRLIRLALSNQTCAEERVYFTLVLHHALTDGWAIQYLLKQAQAAYMEMSLPSTPFSPFVKQLLHTKEDTTSFWQSQFKGLNAVTFPKLPSPDYIVNPTAKTTCTLGTDAAVIDGVTAPSRIKLSWAVLASLYTESYDVVFGTTVTGRGAPVLGVEEMTGPTIASFPMRFLLNPDESVADALHNVQKHSNDTIPFEQAGLQRISRMGPEAAAACQFQSLLVVQPDHEFHPSIFSDMRDISEPFAFSSYAITLNCKLSRGTMELEATYDPQVVSEIQMRRILNQLKHIFKQIERLPTLSLRDLELASPEDLERLRAWNGSLPEPLEQCVHEAIQRRCLEQPDAIAVCSWNGTFSYGDLDSHSTMLATRLAHLGVGPEVFVPLCFEKSRWTIVAMLGVLKAGGAFILLDPSQPVQRLQNICQNVQPSFVLASEANAGRATDLAPQVVVLGDSNKTWMACPSSSEILKAAPDNAMYAAFTSGSTSGQPKGIVISNKAFASCAAANGAAMHLSNTSRVLQFGSYAFDICMAEIFTTLLCGGCICVPSDSERLQNLPQAVARMQANWSFFTSSFARALNPVDFPTLTTIIVGGEIVTRKEITMWQNRDLLIAYGPVECSVICVLGRASSAADAGRRIGSGIRCRTWVVDSDNHERLAPIGAVGELLLEGPNVGRGYLNDPRKTASAFIKSPSWLQRIQGKNRFPVYKTGDLVRYTDDGSLYYIRRKDTQVKVRGQRVELSEIEHDIQKFFEHSIDAVAEPVTIRNESDRQILAAFIHTERRSDVAHQSLLTGMSAPFRSQVQGLESYLSEKLPSYMVPDLFLPLAHLPLTLNGKVDRERLRREVESRSQGISREYASSLGTNVQPSSEIERKLQAIWASVLNMTPDSIGIQDNFFRLGGDSISAMHVAAQCATDGMVVTIADIFRQKTISQLGQSIQTSKPVPSAEAASIPRTGRQIQPLSLVDRKLDREKLLQQAAGICQIPINHIEDIYPCTPLQEGLMALSAKKSGQFIGKLEGELPADINLHAFRSAWVATVAANPILRTRMAQLGDLGTCQVVVHDLPPWQEFDDIVSYAGHIKGADMELGMPLIDFSILRPGSSAKTYKFHMTLHHAIYDGWSLHLIWKHVRAAYYNTPLTPQPFNHFIEYIGNVRGAEKFWRSEFNGLDAPVFPSVPSSKYVPTATSSLHHPISKGGGRNSEFTMSTIIQLAWSIIMSIYTDSEDVVFGLTLNGRSAPVARIDEMTGPTFATIPLRVRVDPRSTVRESLSFVQNKTTAMIPFQQFGLQNISQLSVEAAQACSFQCHLGIQPPSTTKGNDLFAFEQGEHQDYRAFANYAFVLVCHLDGGDENNIMVTANYDENIVHTTDAKRMVHQFEHVLRQISHDYDLPLNKLSLVSLDDRLQLSEWNQHLPPSYDKCLHDLVLAHCARDPTSPAIAAWDGAVSYGELDIMSLQLAKQLQELGVQKGSMVPLCFNKSKWVIITMIAVLRAGGACVSLDPAHPRERIRNILRLTSSRLVLTSPENQGIATGAGSAVATIPFNHQQVPSGWSVPEVTPQDPAFIVFTSGSTSGVPKGIDMQHSALCTSIRDHSSDMNLDNRSRALHFASYAFDASIYEIFSTLGNGGCVCVPSEYDRMHNLAGFIREHQVNFAIFTPSVINTLLCPVDVPHLQTIVLGGEAVTPETVHTWAPTNVTLINGYGPAETTICAVGNIPAHGWVTGTIGPMTGSVGWITTPSDPSRLAPIGAVGELLIEGPVVTRGYLNDPERTAAAYIPAPSWHADFRNIQEGHRLYRTGDLVQYTKNGWIKFAGRKDTQVKLRGQRIELGEVEHHARQCFPCAGELIAEVVVRAEGSGVPVLAVFVYGNTEGTEFNSSEEQGLFVSPDDKFLSQVRATTTKLKGVVPAYMVPGVFLRLSRVPRTPSGKIDRLQLRDQAAVHLGGTQKSPNTRDVVNQEPKNEQEQLLRGLWAAVLKIPTEGISADDDFFHLGGDSVRAMKLASMGRRQGLDLSVSLVFDYPVLSSLTQAAGRLLQNGETDKYQPGSLAGVGDLESFISNFPGQSWPFDPRDVVDILPTTELQHMLLKGKVVTYIQLAFPMRVSPDRLEAACRAIVRQHPTLRTVFVPYEGGYLQVVLRDINFRLLRLNCEDNLEKFTESVCRRDSSSPVRFGTPHFQPYLLSQSDSHHMFVMRTTHAQYDNASLPLVIRDMSNAYNEEDLDLAGPPFAKYLQYRQAPKSPETYQFWNDYIEGSQMTELKPANLARPACCADEHEHLVRFFGEMPLPSPPEGITMGSLAKAAWAVVLARRTGERDVVFGHIINGRDAPIADVANISGPCITMSPFRVTIQPSWATADDLLRHVQSQYRRAMPFANLDFKHMLKRTSVWPVETDFGSVLTHQDGETQMAFPFDGVECSWMPRDFGVPSHFHIVTLPRGDKLAIVLSASCRKISPGAAEELVDEMCEAITDLSRGSLDMLRI
ncbi:nonribosomal peptide synthase [Aspergillus sp. HF37]|nr:nonribosomal peptide synthase [Aspergillus sp. HF37]